MPNKKKPLLIFLTLFSFCVDASAQNSVVTYIETTTSSPLENFTYGIASQASVIVCDIVSLQAGLRLNNRYPSKFGTAKAGIDLYPARGKRNWQIHTSVMYHNYSPWPVNIIDWRILGSWCNDYFRVEAGNAFRFLTSPGLLKYNILRPLLSLRGTLRSPDKVWNLSLFVRNFNRFDTHAQDKVEWGIEVPVKVHKNWDLFCESFVSTVGNFSGTSNYYSCNINLGAVYKW